MMNLIDKIGDRATSPNPSANTADTSPYQGEGNDRKRGERLIKERGTTTQSLFLNRVNRATSSGEMAVGILVLSGLVMVLLAGGMLTQYLRTQVLVSPDEVTDTEFSFTVPSDTALIGEHEISFNVTDGTDTFTSDPVAVVVTAQNQPPAVSAGDDFTVRLPLESLVSGTVTDDGLPYVPGEVTRQWSKADGPGNVDFGDATALDTTVTFSTAGTYTLRLTANDGKASAYDELIATVEPAPPAPDLSVQADKSLLAIGDTVVVNIRIEDATPFANWAQYLEFDNTKLELVDQQAGDFSTFIADTRGLSNINNSGQVRAGGFSLSNSSSGSGDLGIFTFEAIGSGQATISTANKSNSNLFGNALSETDGYEILPDILVGEVIVSVLSGNSAPQVSAGSDQNIQLPIDSVNLSGTVSDDGLPTPPGAVSVLWDKVSGPGDVVFSAASETSTIATFSAAGAYELRLTADDGALTASDEVTIIVDSANGAPIANNDNYYVNQDEVLTVNAPGVLGNDTDPDGDNLTMADIIGPQNGTFSASANGSFVYTPNSGFFGTDQAQYKAYDGSVQSIEYALIEFNVEQKNEPPVVDAGGDKIVNLPEAATLSVSLNGEDFVANENLAGYWKLDDGPGTTTASDASGNGNDGTLVDFDPTTAWVTDTPSTHFENSYALALDGINGHVNIGNIGYNDQITVSAWVKRGQGGNGIIVTKTQSSYEWELTYGNNGYSYFIVNGVNAGTYEAIDGNWHHFLGKYDKNNIYLYIDGVLRSSRPYSNDIADYSQLVGIGARNNANNSFSGVIDDVRIYNYALSENEINSLASGVDLSGQGSVTDDGLPDPPGTVSLAWSKASGPGDVNFSAPNEASTTATFSAAGLYIIRLTADDGEYAVSDELTVTVNTLPTGVGDAYEALRGEDLVVSAPGVLDNDTDADNDDLTAELVDNASNGSLIFNNDGSFTYTPNGTFRGIDSFTYKASDGNGFSEETIVEIEVKVPNAPPQVNAGDDQIISYPDGTTLNGSVTDDGEPRIPIIVSSLSILWTKVSGPGDVFFATPSQPVTTVNFSSAGLYTLRLTANDGELVTADEVMIMVNTIPVSHDDSYDTLRGLLLSVNAPGVLENDSDADGDVLIAQLVDDVTLGDLSLQSDGSFTYVYDPDDSECSLVQGQISTPISCDDQRCNDGPCKRFAPWQDVFTYRATDTRGESSLATVNITIDVTNAPPTVSAGSAQVVDINDGAILEGVVSDDGLPASPGALDILWSMISGPGVVSFDSTSQATASAQFTVPGEYVLRLSANDGEFITASEVIIEVNSAPVVEAGDNETVLINEEAAIAGFVNDDGLPSGGSGLTTQWSQVSGPVEGDISDVLATTTTVTFTEPGDYVLRLTANDGHLTTYDEVTLSAVARYAEVVIPGQTRYVVRPGDTIEIPFEVNTNIIDVGRLVVTMTQAIFSSIIE